MYFFHTSSWKNDDALCTSFRNLHASKLAKSNFNIIAGHIIIEALTVCSRFNGYVVKFVNAQQRTDYMPTEKVDA
jgi:hypothetical protein